MGAPVSLRAILRRTFGIYAAHASVLLMAAVVVDAVVALDQVQFRHSPALATVALLVNLVVGGMFVCVVVLLVDDVWDGGPRRSVLDLLRGAWSALGSLLLVGIVAGIAFTVLASLGSAVVFVVVGAVAFNVGGGMAALFALLYGLLLVPVLILAFELLLITRWSVFAPASVLERPGGLRALGRSRELVRGNGWRVLALIVVLAFPLVLAVGEVETAARAAGGGTALLVARLLVAALVSPIPVLAATALYFELCNAEPAPAPVEPAPSGGLPPSVSLS